MAKKRVNNTFMHYVVNVADDSPTELNLFYFGNHSNNLNAYIYLNMYCVYHLMACQGRIQDLKLGVAQMDLNVWGSAIVLENWKKRGGGGALWIYFKYTIIIV